MDIETRNTYASNDPAFPYLLSFFLLLTSFAWSLAYAQASASNIIRIAVVYVFVHCLATSLLAAGLAFYAVPRIFGQKGFLVGRGGARRRGLFTTDSGEDLEFGFCFDVSGSTESI